MVLSILQVGIQSYNVHVLQLLMNLNFSLKCRCHLLLLKVLLQKLFNREKHFRFSPVPRQEDGTVGALTQLFVTFDD